MPGTIEKRGENSWRISIPGGYDVAGKKIWLARENLKFDSKMTEGAQRRECEKQLALLYSKVNSGQVANSKQITVREFAERWMQEHVNPILTPKSAHAYRMFLDLHILPALGNMKLQDLKPYSITKFLNSLRADGLHKDGGKLSGTTIRHYYSTLSAMLTKAVQWQVLAVSPMTSVAAPKLDTKPAKFYDDAQAIKLLEALQEAPIKHRTAIYIAIFGGLRLGEVTGLEWSDIDMRTNILDVERASQYLPKKGIYTTTTKNDKVRGFSMPSIAMECITDYKKWQDAERKKLGDTWKEHNRLFTKWNGEPMHPQTPSKWFHKFLEDNKLPELTFHSLRHTNATLLFAQGVDLETIKERLGHSNASITADIYGHAIKKNDKEAADKLDDLFK